MSTGLRRTRRYLLLVGVSCTFAHDASAQRTRLSPRELGQIVDAALDSILPRDTDTLFINEDRTLKALRPYSKSTHLSVADLGLRHPVKPGSDRFFDDCNQLRAQPCSQFGSRSYVSIDSAVVSRAEARIVASVSWARRGEPFSSVSGDTFLGWSGDDIYLKRAKDGSWNFLKRSPTMMGN
jgi:hypothetical protein